MYRWKDPMRLLFTSHWTIEWNCHENCSLLTYNNRVRVHIIPNQKITKLTSRLESSSRRAIEILSSRKSFHCLRRRWGRLRSRMEKESFFFAACAHIAIHCFSLAALSSDWRIYDVCDAISLLNSIQFQLAWQSLFSSSFLMKFHVNNWLASTTRLLNWS